MSSGTQSLNLPIEAEQFLIFEDAQSVASGRQLEKPLIFPREIQQNVSRVDAEHQENKEDAFSNNAHGQKHRHKTEIHRACTEAGQGECMPN
jgi:hypothetical protein